MTTAERIAQAMAKRVAENQRRMAEARNQAAKIK
jgi:hypothetical protein